MTPSDASPAMLTLTLFGTMQISLEGQPLPHLRSRKAQALLALLALRQGHALEREWLAGALWPDADQEQAAASLRPVLSELRRALGSHGERLQSPSRHTLALDLVGVDVDVTAFDKAIASQKLSALERAVALYRGPLLEGSAEEWAGQERNAREQDCLRALGTLAAAALAAGGTDTSAKLFRRAVDLAPGWETARRGLMASLDRAGDSNAALQVYREFVSFLRSDPKAVPDEKTNTLYAQIRADAKARASKPVVPLSGTAPARTITGYLPHPVTDLVGREDEQLEVTARLRRSRLVTLTGPGGIGKTRLALAVATKAVPDYAEGVWLVAFDLLFDGSQFARQVALVLGLKEEADRSCLVVVADHLRAKHVLLVLDNCEHLLEAAAAVAGHLMRECAGIRVLATSREALGITGETAWMVPPLSVPDPAHLPTGHATLRQVLIGYEGVQLFVERAQAVQKTFTLAGGNALAVAQVCARLEGIPLAIELAAARIKAMTAEQIAARLDDHLSLLTGGNRAGQSRQQTLRATLDWSYDLLTEAERLLLARLSVFAGGWTLDAAEAVCAGDEISSNRIGSGQVLNLLTSLVDKSLIIFEERPELNGVTGGRYRLLEMVRQYAVQRQVIEGGSGPVQARHQAWYTQLAEQAEPQLTGPDQEIWLRWLDLEHDNLRVALAVPNWERLRPAPALRLASALWRFWNIRGYLNEGRRLLEQVLAQPGVPEDTAIRAKALNGAATLAFHQSDFAAAQSLYEKSLSLSREAGDRWVSAEVLNNLGNLVKHNGDHAQAQKMHEESLTLFQELGDRQGSAEALCCLGNVAYVLKELPSAQNFYQESLRHFRSLGDRGNAAILLGNLGNLTRQQGEYELARVRHEEGLSILQELGSKREVAMTLYNLGNLARHQEEYDLARTRYEQSLSIYREIGGKQGYAMSLSGLGSVAYHQGDRTGAMALFRESLGLRREIRDKKAVASSLREIAAILAAQAQVQKAVWLWGAAHALREDLNIPLLPDEREKYDPLVGQARLVLGNDAFALAWNGGGTLSWEQASAYALEETRTTSPNSYH